MVGWIIILDLLLSDFTRGFGQEFTLYPTDSANFLRPFELSIIGFILIFGMVPHYVMKKGIICG
jgi:hypothetical protein